MLYYTLRNGQYVDEIDLHRAYEIVTGKTYTYDSQEYSKWLHSLLGKSIVSVQKSEDMAIEDFLKRGSTIGAVKVYRERNGCTLREAKDAIDELKKKMDEDENGGKGFDE